MAAKKNQAPKPPGYVFGRPTLYKPEYCEKLIEHMSEGNPFETFGVEIGVSREVLYLWTHTHEDFLNAKKLATDASMKWWLSIGRAGMCGKIQGFQSSVWIFTMKNRFMWHDEAHKSKTEVEQKETIQKAKEELEKLLK